MKHLLNSGGTRGVWATILPDGSESVRPNRGHPGRSISKPHPAAISGLGVTALVQSSTATALIISAFVGQGLVSLPLALAVMLGADIGTSLMTVVFSFDLSWLSPLLIFVGVVLFITRQASPLGRLGRVLIGLGLMLLALRLVSDPPRC